MPGKLTSVRFTPELQARIERVVDVMSKRAAGVRIGFTTVVLLAAEHGLPELEKECGITSKPRKGKAK